MSHFHGLSEVNIGVRDLDKALTIYHDATGFPIKNKGDGWVVVDGMSGANLRLFETPTTEYKCNIRLLAIDVDKAFRALVDAGAVAIMEPSRTDDLELVATVRDPDGHCIEVFRLLTEDEYDFVPELPTELTWAPDATDLLKSLLKSVPFLFRGLARRKVTRAVEDLTGGSKRVTREEVIRGFILASPKVTRGRNRQPLIDHGIDVDKYQQDWDAE